MSRICPKKVAVEAVHQSLSNASRPILFWAVQRLRRTMRNNWILTRAETILFIVGITFIAGGAVWAAGLG
jgi:hypothetical protein